MVRYMRAAYTPLNRISAECNNLPRYTRFNSPYYKDTHRVYRQRVRSFVDEFIMPTYTQWRSEADPPRAIYLEMGRLGFLAAMVGPPFPLQYVDPGETLWRMRMYAVAHARVGVT